MEEILSFSDFETNGLIQLLKVKDDNLAFYILSDTRALWESNSNDLRDSLLLITINKKKMQEYLSTLLSDNPSYVLQRNDGTIINYEEIEKLLSEI
jgi:hypothetical protein